MEKKTIEEMREAVLAYCETVCPNVGDRFDISECAKLLHVVHAGDWHQWQIHCPIFNGGGYTWMAVFKVSPYPSCTDFVDFYRLLGLSERDAVAELREESDKYFTELKAERAKNAALVAALESLKRAVGYKPRRHGEIVLYRNDLGVFIDNALAANEKGGANG